MPLELRRQAGLPMISVNTSPRDQEVSIRTSPEDLALIERLLRRDESAFIELVRRHQALMMRLAQGMVPSRAIAEEVVQETWQAVLEGLPRFEGRSSLRTWIFRILVKRSRTRGERERRSVPVAMAADGEDLADTMGQNEPFNRPLRPLRRLQNPALSGDQTPERRFLDAELRRELALAIEALPLSLMNVLTLRDVMGWTSEEVCNVLDITETNQRVMLHRARTRVRARLAGYLEGDRHRC